MCKRGDGRIALLLEEQFLKENSNFLVDSECFVCGNTTFVIGPEQSSKNKYITTTVSKWLHRTLKGQREEMVCAVAKGISVL